MKSTILPISVGRPLALLPRIVTLVLILAGSPGRQKIRPVIREISEGIKRRSTVGPNWNGSLSRSCMNSYSSGKYSIPSAFVTQSDSMKVFELSLSTRPEKNIGIAAYTIIRVRHLTLPCSPAVFMRTISDSRRKMT